MQHTIKSYAWKLAGLAKNVDINDAVQELERIEGLYGSLTPENVLNASRPKNALFHSLFEWNDSIAAEHYRLQQARTILNNIEVKIISNGQPKQIAVYEVVNTPAGNQYKNIDTMSASDINFIKQRTLKELNILKDKLNTYKQFANVISQLNTVIGTLTSTHVV
jgi:hypothetical protein